jgi:hypothetical protein
VLELAWEWVLGSAQVLEWVLELAWAFESVLALGMEKVLV